MKIPSSRPHYSTEEKQALNRVLDSGFTAEGDESRLLAEELSSLLNIPHITVAASGSAAWGLLLHALGIGEGDQVIVPAYACQAVVNPILERKATPVLADVSPRSYGLTAETVEPCLDEDTELILHIHPFGYPLDQDDLYQLDLPVVEDIAQAVGAGADQERPVGHQGIACIGSLYATKQLAAGYGGFIGTGKDDLYDELLDLKQYDGRTELRPTHNVGLSDLLAAVARCQLSRLSDHLDERRRIARRYDQAVADVEALAAADRPPGHVVYRYLVETEYGEQFQTHMRNLGIEVKRPVHHPLTWDLPSGDCPVAERLHHQLRLIPLLPAMSEPEIEHVVEAIRSFSP